MYLVASSVFLSLLEVVAANEPRIVGGSDVTTPSKYPYQVSLQKASGHICGGSILNNRWILTAAHCIYHKSDRILIRIKLGSIDVRLNWFDNFYRIRYVRYHQNYDNDTQENDIGMIRVDGIIKFNQNVQPIALPTEDFMDFDSPVVFTGWGDLSTGGSTPTIILQEIELKAIPYNICKSYVNSKFRLIEGTNICTLTKRGEGICMGDSGGPLVAKGVQIGIASFAKPCALGAPDVFTKVYAYVDWINYVVTNAKKCHEPHLVIHFCASFSALFVLQCLLFTSVSF